MRYASRAVVIKDNQLLLMHRNKFGMEYYALVGGGVDPGETPEQALYREVTEEASITIANERLVILEDAGKMYGIQYIYLCDYVSGEPVLHPASIEQAITADGKNLYTPLWLPLDKLPDVTLLPAELKATILDCLKHGWPTEPIKLTIRD